MSKSISKSKLPGLEGKRHESGVRGKSSASVSSVFWLCLRFLRGGCGASWEVSGRPEDAPDKVDPSDCSIDNEPADVSRIGLRPLGSFANGLSSVITFSELRDPFGALAILIKTGGRLGTKATFGTTAAAYSSIGFSDGAADSRCALGTRECFARVFGGLLSGLLSRSCPASLATRHVSISSSPMGVACRFTAARLARHARLKYRDRQTTARIHAVPSTAGRVMMRELG